MPSKAKAAVSKPSVKQDPMAVLRRRVASKLSGFTPDVPRELDSWGMPARRLDPSEFPVPELVLFTLRNLMEWRWTGRGEKERWAVFGSVGGNPVGFALRKFGFDLLRGEPDDVDDSRIIGQLKGALKIVEESLEPFAQHQIDTGELIVANRFAEFVNRYNFFRSKAEAAFKRSKRKPGNPGTKNPVAQVDSVFAGINRSWAATREGFFYSTAMVDSYFSALEHRLTLLKAFKGRPLAEGEFRRFLSLKWDEKLSDILSMKGNRAASLNLGRMRDIKERIRNPFAHGGNENDHGSLFIHIPHIGAVPANFSRHSKSVRFKFFPIEADGHAETCAVFDELDNMLTSGGFELPHRMIDAGVDPSYDQRSISTYGAAVAGGSDALEDFIRGWSMEWERHANMDY